MSKFLRKFDFLQVILILSLALLYIPIIVMVVGSFNASQLANHWTGFTLEWFVKLFNDRRVLEAALLSVEIAFLASTISVILGTLIGISLVRVPRFFGRLLLTTMITAPLVMPDVITGLCQALLFNQTRVLFGWPTQGGFVTILLAHITFTMAYAAVTIQSRMLTVDRSLEDAAMDLGAGPVRAFVEITLPIIAPALFSSWLLGLTLSLDDVVIASFVTGPGATTLPMTIYSKVKLGVSPDMNALATIILAIVGAGVIISNIIMVRAEKQRQLDESKAMAEAH
ncbi:MAG: ABC transporter permease subunit [Candidatus Pacebacteria bacterium]|nr:ABC transporter permease subunit [Candidatus Paceibacterota bacterium]